MSKEEHVGFHSVGIAVDRAMASEEATSFLTTIQERPGYVGPQQGVRATLLAAFLLDGLLRHFVKCGWCELMPAGSWIHQECGRTHHLDIGARGMVTRIGGDCLFTDKASWQPTEKSFLSIIAGSQRPSSGRLLTADGEMGGAAVLSLLRELNSFVFRALDAHTWTIPLGVWRCRGCGRDFEQPSGYIADAHTDIIRLHGGDGEVGEPECKLLEPSEVCGFGFVIKHVTSTQPFRFELSSVAP